MRERHSTHECRMIRKSNREEIVIAAAALLANNFCGTF